MKTREVIGYVNAGGRGTRLNGLFAADPKTGIAKALLEIGTPSTTLIDHHIANLRHQGVRSINVSAGDQTEVYEYIKDTYRNEAEVSATQSAEQLGTGGDLIRFARTLDKPTPLLVQNVDTILDIDLYDFAYHYWLRRELGGVASIALTLNRGTPNQDAFAVNAHGEVVDSAEFNDSGTDKAYHYRGSSTGAVMIDSDFLSRHAWTERQGQLSLYRDCLRRAWEQEGLYAYNNATRFFRDVGTVAAWLASEEDMELQDLLRYNQRH